MSIDIRSDSFTVPNDSFSPRESDSIIVDFHLNEVELGCDIGQTSSFALFFELKNFPHPVISNLGQSLNIDSHPIGPNTRVILVEREEETFAFPVSRINGIFKVPRQEIFISPPIFRETISHPGLVGFAIISNRLVLLLDLEKIISTAPRIPIEDLEQ